MPIHPRWPRRTTQVTTMTQAQADMPPHRYTAELASEIERRWQDHWEEHGTFHAPNPVGPLADPGHPRAGADEQYAVQTGTHPRKTTEENVERYRAQLRRLGLAYDDRRSFATTDVEYYRWTQWIFL